MKNFLWIVNNRCMVIGVLIGLSMSTSGSMTPRQQEFLALYNDIELRSFCGNSPGTSGDGLKVMYGVDDRQMGLMLAEQVANCLHMTVPRAESTNMICSVSLRKLSKFKVPEALPVAQAAFLDSSDMFRSESVRAFFACVSNVSDVVSFASNVWADVSMHATSRRLDCVIGLKRWIPTRTDLTDMDKQALYADLTERAQAESSFPVAMRMDQVLKTLSADYLVSSVRTNVVLRFKDSISAPNDPQYFRRQAEEMGILR